MVNPRPPFQGQNLAVLQSPVAVKKLNSRLQARRIQSAAWWKNRVAVLVKQFQVFYQAQTTMMILDLMYNCLDIEISRDKPETLTLEKRSFIGRLNNIPTDMLEILFFLHTW